MEEKSERSDEVVSTERLTIDLSEKTGQHIRLVLNVPKGGQNEG